MKIIYEKAFAPETFYFMEGKDGFLMAIKMFSFLFLFLSFAVYCHSAVLSDNIRVYAYSDGFHTFIVLPDTCGICPDSLLEYEYAEKAWYLDGKNQWYRVFSVLFMNTEGTVGESRRTDKSFPVPAENRFAFRVGMTQYKMMRDCIESWVDRKTILLQDGNETFYRSTKPYNALNSCHSFVLKVLKAGGVDVNPKWGITSGLAVRQLRKAQAARFSGGE